MKRRSIIYGLLFFAFVTTSNKPTAAKDLADAIASQVNLKGGIVVHVGNISPAALVNSANAGRFIVQALLFDEASVAKSRRAVLAEKTYGLVSVVHGAPYRFPYTDNLVNVVVIDDPEAFAKAGASVAEIARILAPEGVVLVAGQHGLRKSVASALVSKQVTNVDGWTKIVKPRPEEMDEWTHPRHDAEGTAVSQDTAIGYTGALQWRQGPIWMDPGVRSLSTEGKNYYLANGVIACRDSFNGVLLWRRESSKDAVNAKGFRLVDTWKVFVADSWQDAPFTAIGNRVYTILPNAPHLVALDGSTGRTVLHYKNIKAVGRSTLVHVGSDILFASDTGVGSVNRQTGKLNWMNSDIAGRAKILCSDQYILRFDKQELQCLSRTNGMKLWSKDYRARKEIKLFVAKYGVCALKYFPTGDRTKGSVVEVLSLKDGALLWKKEIKWRIGPGSDLHAFDGLIWDTSGVRGYDPLTGELKKGGKHSGEAVLRCVRDSAATVKYFFSGRPFGFIDVHTGEVVSKQIVRNGCMASPGMLLGNGMIYGFPKQCGCYPMLRGYTGFAPHKTLAPTADDERLLKGPAYGTVKRESLNDEYTAQWRTYLGNEQRSGRTNETISLPIKELWRVKPEDQDHPEWARYDWKANRRVSSPITAPTASDGLVAVALPESHRVIVFDASSGKVRWSFICDSRVVLPPTFYGRLVLFGGEDGYVYCLRSSDGALIWRYQAAPAQRLINMFGQLESHWPVTGGVLVKNGQAYFAAGRNGDLNHGITGYKIDAYTGELAWKKALTTIDRKKSTCAAELPIYVNGEIRLALNSEILDEKGLSVVAPAYSSRERRRGEASQPSVSTRTVADVKMLTSSNDGLLDHTWDTNDRKRGKGGKTRQRFGNVSGGHVIYNDTTVFAANWGKKRGVAALDMKFAHLKNFSTRRRKPTDPPLAYDPTITEPRWTVAIDAVRAIAVSRDSLFVASTTGEESGILAVHDAVTGKTLHEVKLNTSPLRWGLAIADDKIYLSTDEGHLLCFSAGT